MTLNRRWLPRVVGQATNHGGLPEQRPALAGGVVEVLARALRPAILAAAALVASKESGSPGSDAEL
jgi:hypothetical protein